MAALSEILCSISVVQCGGLGDFESFGDFEVVWGPYLPQCRFEILELLSCSGILSLVGVLLPPISF